MINSLLWLQWDPNPVAFYLPYFNLPIFIYALFFMGGFVLGYYLLIPIIQKEIADRNLAVKLVDRLTWSIMAGMIIGARLGHVFFYDWARYRNNLLSILNTREGGLASHGGAVGVLLAIYLFQKFELSKSCRLSFIELLDRIAIPTALVCFFIRIGNFFNQEIVGTPSSLPWAVLFGHPAEGVSAVPRHPVQLYEALSYLFTFFLLFGLWNFKRKALKAGFITGLFFVIMFLARFMIEFAKAQQTAIIDQSFLQIGQILSVPFILFGIFLIAYSLMSKSSEKLLSKK